MHFAKITRFQRIHVPPFHTGAATCENLMDFWAKTLFQNVSPDMIGKRNGGPFIYTKPFALTSYNNELRDAANSLSHFMRYFTIHGFIPEHQPISSSDTMLVRAYISERQNQTLSALFFMERLSGRAGEAFGAEYFRIINDGKCVPTESQWEHLSQTDSWIQHIFPEPDKNRYNFGMTPELR